MLPRYLRIARALSGVSALVSVGCGSMVSSSPPDGDGGRNDVAVNDASADVDFDDVDTDDAIVVTETSLPADTSTPPDTAKPPIDTSTPPTDVGRTGTCKDWGSGITCTSPNVCGYGWGGSFPDSGGEPAGPYCGPPPDGGSITACGAIGCAQPCWCENAAQSICSCQIAVGPLPPPDLPAS